MRLIPKIPPLSDADIRELKNPPPSVNNPTQDQYPYDYSGPTRYSPFIDNDNDPEDWRPF